MAAIRAESTLLDELKAAVAARLDPFAANRVDPRDYRLNAITLLLELLRNSDSSLLDLTQVLNEIKSGGGPFAPGDTFEVSLGGSCLSSLSESERQELQENLENHVDKIQREFPELVAQFPAQFSLDITKGLGNGEREI